PAFKEEKDGALKSLMFYAKRARGMMARYIIEHRIESPDGLKDFSVGGYRFQPSLSTETDWVFTRPQPKPKAA
ncbi:MAG: peroxide stress protein YaaA, partial [Pseudomonadota bacterium]